jgi:MFS superfamily sulfate permease-like transporter
MRYTVWRNDRLISTISVLAVLFIGVLQGLLVAVGISIIMMLRQIANASITELGRLGNSHDFVSLSLFQNANAVEGLLILRPDQALFFANADRILLLVRRAADFTMAHTHTVILSLELSNGLDTTSVEALRGFFLHLRQSGKRLILARLKDPVHDVLQLALGSDFPEVLLSRLSVSHAVRTATEPTEA